MIIRACAFTNKGLKLLTDIEEKCEDHIFDIKAPSIDSHEWISDSFKMRAPIVFIGAAAIAVRYIAPYVADKRSDSPVIVIDEMGQYVIPILSGHLGGANELAKELAGIIAAQPVITTATDINETFAVDIFAKKNGLKICNKEGIKKVSSKLLNEGHITMAVNPSLEYDKDMIPSCIEEVSFDKYADLYIDTFENEDKASDCLLKLVFKPYVLGLGCKKNTSYEHIEKFVSENLCKAGISKDQIAFMASIDLKKKEYGLLQFESFNRIPFLTYSGQELEKVNGDFTESDFVKKITGVDNVCERAAMMACKEDGKIVVKKLARDGVTMAIGQRKGRIDIWES